MLTVACIIVALLVLAYWFRFQVWRDRRLILSGVAVLPLMAMLLLYINREASSGRGHDGAVLLAIATDVSLSMGTLPGPGQYAGIGTRLERAQNILLPLFAQLVASTRPTLVSISAFTSKSETVLAWDDDLALSGEIVSYVLSTGLLTEAGSDIGAALNGVLPLFDNLPESFRDSAQAKFLIIVSDGEQTKTRGNVAIALEKLQQLGVRLIAIHVGRSDVPEGLPVYDESGEFIGFEEIDGQIFSVPDSELMMMLAGEDEQRGLYVGADDRNSVNRILQFIGIGADTGITGSGHLGTVLLLWSLMVFGIVRTF